MPFVVKMPKLSPTMENGTIVKWHKQEGEQVQSGDVLIEVATDKATVEFNALDEGYLRQILVTEGSDAKLNQPIAVFTESADESLEGFQIEEEKKEKPKSEEEQESTPTEKPQPEETAIAKMAEPAFVPEPPLQDYQFDFAIPEHQDRLLASPLARRIAKEKNLDLSTIKGSGPGGRVMSRDLDNAQPDAIATFGRQEYPRELPGTYEEEPLSPMRKVIGERLKAAKTFIPHFYVQQEFNAEPMMETREELKANGIKVTFNDFIVRACALALRQHPVINSGFNNAEQKIIRFKSIDISIAVSLPDGLITPILRHADHLNLGQISSMVRRLAKKAKAGKMHPEEFKGGSFTISNLGMYGISDFRAVINPPQVSILAVGGIIQKPVVKNNQVVPGHTMTLSLSSDHRVVDGADAAQFVQTLKKLLENPSILLIG